MKKSQKAITAILIGFMACTIQASAKSSEANTQLQEFYYNKGYKDASILYYKKGYRQAIRDIKKQLRKFKAMHDAIEASKYLSLTGKITYPEVMKITNGNGEYKIIILPSRVEKPFSVYDLIRVPNAKIFQPQTKAINAAAQNKNSKMFSGQVNKNAFYGFYDGASQKDNTSVVMKKPQVNNKVKMVVAKTQQNKSVLDAAGVTYTEDANNYIVSFAGNFAKNVFCNGIGAELCKE